MAPNTLVDFIFVTVRKNVGMKGLKFDQMLPRTSHRHNALEQWHVCSQRRENVSKFCCTCYTALIKLRLLILGAYTDAAEPSRTAALYFVYTTVILLGPLHLSAGQTELIS